MGLRGWVQFQRTPWYLPDDQILVGCRGSAEILSISICQIWLTGREESGWKKNEECTDTGMKAEEIKMMIWVLAGQVSHKLIHCSYLLHTLVISYAIWEKQLRTLSLYVTYPCLWLASVSLSCASNDISHTVSYNSLYHDSISKEPLHYLNLPWLDLTELNNPLGTRNSKSFRPRKQDESISFFFLSVNTLQFHWNYLTFPKFSYHKQTSSSSSQNHPFFHL